MVALHSLVTASRKLGIPPGSDLPIVKDLVYSFVEGARALDGWKAREAEGAAQAALDLSFLAILVEEESKSDVTIQKLLVKVSDTLTRQAQPTDPKVPSTMPDDYAEQLPSLVQDHLRRCQLLLQPILGHIKASVVTSKSDGRNGLLRFGAPKTSSGVGAEFKSPLAVAKPSKRFDLLSIAA